ncbi:Lrp/AsnC family transcriptional regulator [Crocinitomicaceae bacterium]|nr:Lrp/AsnC family transcriptional regulator [Crocinitomicaceae bacterium]|tara:strand:- start:148 stop:579 length:432 start_codon:yes stop_codon:yes gene_type:complete
MDKIDRAILEILSENSKLGTKEIAMQVGLTLTPTYERIKRLEKSGVIKNYTVELDKKAIGKSLQVFCQVSLKEHNLKLLKKFEDQVVEFPEVSACYHIAGDHDYALLIEVFDMSAYEKLLREKLATIPSIANVQSSFVMREIK